MKRQNFVLLMLLIFAAHNVKSQDEWEPQTHVTGYINAVFEWTDVESDGAGFDKNYALGLSEVGLLVTHKPSEKLELKSTLVYTHFTFDVSQIFVEAYGMYSFHELLKLGVGRFLTPLSPANLYFYAPLNPSGALPMVVSHHFLFPQNISGFQLKGETDLGNIKLGYAGAIGMYQYINHFESGVLGLQSQEETHAALDYYETRNDKIYNYLGGTGRLYFIYDNWFTVGVNTFMGDAQQVTDSSTINVVVNPNSRFNYFPSVKSTFGFDLHIDIANIKVNAEYWLGQQETTDDSDDLIGRHVKSTFEGYYGEIIYNHDVFKPFLRYDYIQDVELPSLGKFPGKTTTLGIAIRPMFETLLKLEYKLTNAKRFNNDGTLRDYSYNNFQFSFVLSF